MSDQRDAPPPGSRPAACRLSMVVPSDDRFRVVFETAVRIFMRSVCSSSDPTPEVKAALVEMVTEVAALDPIEVDFNCRLPELVISVTSGARRASRTFKFEAQD